MDKELCECYASLLRRELIPSFGCTEPVIIAYAAAKARAVLGVMPERLELECSGNIIKNVKSVTVPNSGGRKGIEIAAALGAIAGDEESALNVLAKVLPADAEKAVEFVAGKNCSYSPAAGVPKLYVAVNAFAGEHSSRVVISETHTNISEIRRDGELILKNESAVADAPADNGSLELDMKSVYEYASAGDIGDVAELVENQARCNRAVAEEGLKNSYGGNVGKTILNTYGGNIGNRAAACAAAGADARMSGCALPVIINSGSGNQGITIAVPISEYAKELGASREQLCRALVLGNLVSIYIKKNIGVLSAFCGAVNAACGAGAGMAYLCGFSYDEICTVVSNTLANVSGIICDGAKPACAAKIASAVGAALLSMAMVREGNAFLPGDGIVKETIDETIRGVGQIAANGMVDTDVEIIKEMIS